MFSNPEIHSSSLEILNFGVSGYATDQEYLLYQRNGLEFDVDEVVLAFTPYNDVIGNLEKKQYGYLKPYFKIVEGELILHQDHIHDSIGRNISNQIRFHSRLVNTLERSYRIYRDNQKYKDADYDISIARKKVYEEGDELSEVVVEPTHRCLQPLRFFDVSGELAGEEVVHVVTAAGVRGEDLAEGVDEKTVQFADGDAESAPEVVEFEFGRLLGEAVDVIEDLAAEESEFVAGV